MLDVYILCGATRAVVCRALPPGCVKGYPVANTRRHYLCPSHSYMDKKNAIMSHGGYDLNLVSECQTERKSWRGGGGTHG